MGELVDGRVGEWMGEFTELVSGWMGVWVDWYMGGWMGVCVNG